MPEDRETVPARRTGLASAAGTAGLLAVATLANYLAWLGWDRQKDVLPDGSTTGPYQPWQVAAWHWAWGSWPPSRGGGGIRRSAPPPSRSR